MPRRRLRWGLVLAGLAVAAICIYVLWTRGQPTLEKFRSIRNGMTRAEVEATLGPPRDYRSAPTSLYHMEVFWPDDGAYWQTDDGAFLVVYLEGTDQVWHHSFLPARRIVELSPFESIVWHVERIGCNSFPGKQKAPQ
jgi:hypothetical protein